MFKRKRLWNARNNDELFANPEAFDFSVKKNLNIWAQILQFYSAQNLRSSSWMYLGPSSSKSFDSQSNHQVIFKIFLKGGLVLYWFSKQKSQFWVRFIGYSRFYMQKRESFVF